MIKISYNGVKKVHSSKKFLFQFGPFSLEMVPLFSTRPIIPLPEDPFLVPGVDQFSNSNIFVLDQLIAEANTALKASSSSILH